LAAPHFQPRQHPQLIALLHRVSDRVPAEQPGVAAPIASNEAASKAARLLWTTMSDDAPQQDSQ
jgi:hypothetical protein